MHVAAFCAPIARLIYRPLHELHGSKQVEQLGLRVEDTISTSGCQVAVFRHEDTEQLVVAYRGTEMNLANPAETYRDLRTDLNAQLVDDDGLGRVHAGFQASYLTTAGQLFSALRLANVKDARGVIFTGHSLGGALALLASLDFASHYVEPPKCVTFGCPPLGDQQYTSAISKLVEVTRVYRCFDIVPRMTILRLGLSRLINGAAMRHASGNEIYIDRHGAVHFSPECGFVFLDRLWRRWSARGSWLLSGVAEHSMDDYDRIVRTLV